MSRSYQQTTYHVVFCTKYRQKSLPLEHSRELYNYIWGIIKNRKARLFRINGIEDHLHLLINLPSSMSLASLVRDIKAFSSTWLRQNPNFPEFQGWADNYAAFTYAYRDRNKIANYIRKQREHHKRQEVEREIRQIFFEQGMRVDERFFEG